MAYTNPNSGLIFSDFFFFFFFCQRHHPNPRDLFCQQAGEESFLFLDNDEVNDVVVVVVIVAGDVVLPPFHILVLFGYRREALDNLEVIVPEAESLSEWGGR